MENFPNEILYLVCDELSSAEVSTLTRASRSFRNTFQPILYYLHALRPERSAVAWAVDAAFPDQPAARKRTLAILDKVKQFSQIKPGSLDTTYVPLDDNINAYEVNHGIGYIFDLGIARSLYYEARLPFPRSSFYMHLSEARCFSHLQRIKSCTPLHLAACKGLNEAVEWLMSNGATLNVSMVTGAMVTPILLAVIRDHIPTASLLLAGGASPQIGPVDEKHDDEEKGGEEQENEKLTVVHLACALGSTDMVRQLLELSTGNIQPDTTDLLRFYAKHGVHKKAGAPGMVGLLVSHGAEVANRDDMFRGFLRTFRWISALELLESNEYRHKMSATRATDLVRDLLASRHLKVQAKTAENIIRQLLDVGADPSLGKLLWVRSGELGFPAMLHILRPFFDAGMDFGVDSRLPPPRRGSPWPRDIPGDRLQLRFDFMSIHDLLGHLSALDKDQDEQGSAAQLAIIRLMLQHGAPILGPTRGYALDSLCGVLQDGDDARRHWAFRLCNALLEHCHQTPLNQRGKDVAEFLRRASYLKIPER